MSLITPHFPVLRRYIGEIKVKAEEKVGVIKQYYDESSALAKTFYEKNAELEAEKQRLTDE